MKPAISTTTLVTTLLGTGILVFNALGITIAFGEVAPAKGIESADMLIRAAHSGVNHTWYLDLWTLPQRVWMTLGCLLIVGGRLFDARFHRE